QSTLSRMVEERDKLRQELEEQRRLVPALFSARECLALSCSRLVADAVQMEVYEALKETMEKLQLRFRAVMQEKADLKERLEELEHRCIQLSGETDTIGEYIALYQNQRALMKQRNTEKDRYISKLAKEKEDMKVKLAELQELVERLVGERDCRHSGSFSDPDLLSNTMEPELEEDVEPRTTHPPEYAGNQTCSHSLNSALDPVPKREQIKQTEKNGTTRQIMQLLREIQEPQTGSVPFPGINPSIPFFYRPDIHNQVNILVM
uniref:Golgin subfamily A conserved domain-containing protein n=1 Tax=Scleropages formosus TaxID=113540 RepID=A0A8C9WLX5_SCLFO